MSRYPDGEGEEWVRGFGVWYLYEILIFGCIREAYSDIDLEID